MKKGENRGRPMNEDLKVAPSSFILHPSSFVFRVVHLMASPFLGGPEKQMLGLARHLPRDVESSFLSFFERGLAHAFLDEARRHGFEALALRYNTPHVFACIDEVADELRRLRADLLTTSGYKPDFIGWRAARRVGIPIVAVSHGWTAATWKVRCYEALDRFVLRHVDAVVGVSQAQADKVRDAGVDSAKIHVIRNGIGAESIVEPSVEVRAEMLGWFGPATPNVSSLIGAAGRLSPEKGFAVLVDAAAIVCQQRPGAGFIVFGDGPLRSELEQLIARRALRSRFVLAGFRNDLNRFLPNLDLAVMPSFTEGLPVALLEAGAAGLASVATNVGGIPEVIADGVTGCLVPSGDAESLARRIVELLDDEAKRRVWGRAARERAVREFTFAAMGARYYELFRKVLDRGS